MVDVDGERAFSFQTQISEVAGRAVTTIEGLSRYSLHPDIVADEVARLRGVDPIELTLELLKNTPRGRAVLERVVRIAGRGTKSAAGRALGFCLHRLFKFTTCWKRRNFGRPNQRKDQSP